MLGSLPDAGLRSSGCLVVMVNSLLEVVKVLEAERGEKEDEIKFGLRSLLRWR